MGDGVTTGSATGDAMAGVAYKKMAKDTSPALTMEDEE